MNITYLRSIAGAAVACAAGFYLTTSTFAATVNLDSTVQNGNFEGGLTDWSQCCSGSPGASTYTPTTARIIAPSLSQVAEPLRCTFPSAAETGRATSYKIWASVLLPARPTRSTCMWRCHLLLIDAGLANHLDQTVITAELVVDNGGGLSIPGTLTENVSYVNAAPSALLPTGITSLGTWELITLSATATGSQLREISVSSLARV